VAITAATRNRIVSHWNHDMTTTHQKSPAVTARKRIALIQGVGRSRPATSEGYVPLPAHSRMR
jgi:hypothetical protein